MPDFLSLINALEAITKNHALTQPPRALAVAPIRAVPLGLDRRLFNPKNW